MTTAASSATASASLTSSAIASGKAPSDAAASQDRFLKLLVAQLNNQDPLNPVDNAQMTSQMAQINTVQGIQQLNDTVKAMTAQFGSLQVLQGASLVGRGVLVDDNRLTIENGAAKGSVDLVGNADKVTVQVLSPGGQVLDTLQLGAQNVGRSDFVWDASKYSGTGNPSFKVSASMGGAAVAATPLSRATVKSVGSENGVMTVQLIGRASVGYDAIKAIL